MLLSPSRWLLFGGAFTAALAHKIHIISPQPGAQVQAGCTLNVTLQIEHASNGSFQQVLGFGLNSDFAAHPKALGEVFLGLVNSTQAPVDPSTGQQSLSLSIPPQDKFAKGIEGSYSLVISQYVISGPLHTPHCSLVSVPVNVTTGNCSTSPSNSSASGQGPDCGGKPCPGAQAPAGDRSGSSGLPPSSSGSSNSSTSGQPPVPLDGTSSHPSGAGGISTVAPPSPGSVRSMTSPDTPHGAGSVGNMTSPDTPLGAGSTGNMNSPDSPTGSERSGNTTSPVSPNGAGASGKGLPAVSTDGPGNSGKTPSAASHSPGSSGNTATSNNDTSHPAHDGAGGSGEISPVTPHGVGSSGNTPSKPEGTSKLPVNPNAGNTSSSPMSTSKNHNATTDAIQPTESPASSQSPGPNIFRPTPAENEGKNTTSSPDTSGGSALGYDTRAMILTFTLLFTATVA